MEEIVIIAKYYLGIVEAVDCKGIIRSNYSQLLFLIVWVTKLENNQNTEKYYTDMRLFVTRNAWEIIDISDIKLYESEIFEYIDLIEIDKFEEHKKCFKENSL